MHIITSHDFRAIGKKGPRFTDWFPMRDKPERSGTYVVNLEDGRRVRLAFDADTGRWARTDAKKKAWRGLTKQAYKATRAINKPSADLESFPRKPAHALYAQMAALIPGTPIF